MVGLFKKLLWVVFSLILLFGLGISNVSHAQTKTYYQNNVLVLMYHHIDHKESGSTISPKRFEKQIKTLKQNGYQVISVERFQKFLHGKANIPKNAVVLTFDDGYESFYTYAYPILKKYDMVATNFVIGRSSDKNDVPIPHLTWDQMRKMKKDGFSFYNHTYNQHDYKPINQKGKTEPMLSHALYIKGNHKKENPVQYRNRIYKDLLFNEKRLGKELKNNQRMLAFPYGSYNNEVIDVAKRIGIDLLFTVKPGINGKGQDLIYRINAGSPKINSKTLLKEMHKYDQSRKSTSYEPISLPSLSIYSILEYAVNEMNKKENSR